MHVYCILFHLDHIYSSLYYMIWDTLCIMWGLTYDFLFIIIIYELTLLFYESVLYVIKVCFLFSLSTCFHYMYALFLISSWLFHLVLPCSYIIISLVLNLGGMRVVYVMELLLYFTCWVNPIILWKHLVRCWGAFHFLLIYLILWYT